MVSHRYQLLPQQSQEVNFNYGTVADINKTKVLQYIVFSFLLSILFLYYGYQGFSHNVTWHSKIENRDNNSLTKSYTYSMLFQNNSIRITTNSWNNTLVSFEHVKISTTAAILPNVHATKGNSVPILNTTSSSFLRSTTLAQPFTTVSIKTTPELIISTPANNSTTTTQPLTRVSIENLLDYYVHSSQCRMPRVDIFKSSLNKSFKLLSAAKCAKDEPFIHVAYNTTTRRYSLHMNTKVMQQTKLSIICCYEQIVRSGGNGAYADMKAKILPCTNFLQDFVVPTHIEAMLIKCSSKGTKKLKSRILQEDAFSFVQYKNITTKASTVNINGNDKRSRNVPSLLLIGIDSLSRFNFRQNMPKTLDYIVKHNWFELEGYNKVADNTFPNLMALLTGFNQTRAHALCKPTIIGGLNKCPFIWNYFKSAAYRTAYAEDIASLSTFNFNKKGFRLPPTDHYLRPFILAIEKNLKVIKTASLPYCVGRRQYGEYIYDYAQQFAECYRNESIFGLFWTNSFSHNRYDVSSSMDLRMRRYFEEFERNGVFNDSIIFFYSDHGMRFGSVIEKPEGFLEERLPMFFISLPQWFQIAHPDFVHSLQINRNRLTTPFDIHMTMMHLLQLTQHPQLKILQLEKYHAEGCKRCQSVFHEMPANRSCDDANIPLHWCTCIPYTTLHPKDKLVQNITKNIIEHMNAYIAHSKDKGISDCSILKLDKVNSAEVQMRESTYHGDSSTYRIKFITTPKAASFQATANYNKRTKALNVIVDDISRLNSYAKDSTCVNDSQIKKYCICKSSLIMIKITKP